MTSLSSQINKCTICKHKLPLGPRPIFAFSKTSKILIIGQAPGIRVHESGIPWNDPSWERLREWMGIDSEIFYDKSQIAIMPMGLCYPGTGKTWDLPPTKECAPKWHHKILEQMEQLECILLIGTYAQTYYLGKDIEKTLTQRVKNYKKYLPKYFVLPHPSPRNNIWMKKNSWFQEQVVPELKKVVSQYL